MNLHGIKTVYSKEILDLLRDRRTIISMIVVPILLMPAIMLTLVPLSAKMVGQARQEIPKVMILGGKDSTNTLAALENLKTIKVVPASPNYSNLVSDKIVRAAVEIPHNFDANVRRGEAPTIRIYTYEGELKSTFAADAIEQFFRERKDAIVSNRLAAAQLPEMVLTPFRVRRANVAPPQKVSGNLIGMILPYLVIVMCMTGSIYPAVDLTAGEKERGTMETLLTSPSPRSQLVLGKCLVVMSASIVTATLALSSNGIALVLMKRLMSGPAAQAPLSLDLPSLAIVGVVMIPLAVFFAATMVAIGLYSRSSKEANSYLQPLLILAVLPAAAAALPGIEINATLAAVPVINVSLLSKELLSGTFHWRFMAEVFVSMSGYAALAVAAAVMAFKRETVLFRT